MRNNFVKQAVSKILISIMVLFLINANAAENQSYSGPLADDHIHYVDFTQNSSGMNNLFLAMNKADVTDAVVVGLPLIKKWSNDQNHQPIYYLDDDSPLYYYGLTDVIVARAYLALPSNEKKHLHPFLCGFDPTDRNAINQVKLMFKLYPNVWQGIGEIITRHGVLSYQINGEPAKANSKSLDPIYEFAAEKRIPILLHADLATISSEQNANTASFPRYLSEVENAVNSHPDTIFIWAHAGLDRDINVPNYLSIITDMLIKHKNLYIDISGFALPYIVENKTATKTWLDLINRFPNRVIFGTDAVGNFDGYPDKIKLYRTFLGNLSPDIARKVAYENLMSILKNEGNENA